MEACERIRQRLRTRRRTHETRETQGERKFKWAKEQAWPNKNLERRQGYWELEPRSPSSESNITHHELIKTANQVLGRAWRSSWVRHGGDPVVIPDSQLHKPFAGRLKLHQGLTKAQSSLATQLRTGKIGLAAFLNLCRVPDYPSPACQCGWHTENPEHILLFCPRFTQVRNRLIEHAGTRDLATMLGTPKGLRAATTWVMSLGLLRQYDWARRFIDP